MLKYLILLLCPLLCHGQSWLLPISNTQYYEGEQIILKPSFLNISNVSKVEYFKNNEKIGQVTAAPFELKWKVTTAENVNFTYLITDNLGITTLSNPVQVVVSSFSASSNLIASYDFNATTENLGKQGWIDTNLDGNDWKWKVADGVGASGAFFHSLPKDGNYIASPSLQLQAGVTYSMSFWARQQVSDTSRPLTVAIGTTPNRSNIVTTLNTYNLPGNSYNLLPFNNYSPTFTPVVSGVYHLIFFVENATGYKDIFIDDVKIHRTIFPKIQIDSPVQNQIFLENDNTGTGINFDFTTIDLDGAVAKLELYQNSNLLTTITKSFNDTTFTWPRVLPGIYNFVAKATDNEGNISLSDTIKTTLNFSDNSLTKYIHWNFDGPNQAVVFDSWKFGASGDWRFRSNGGWQNSAHAEAFVTGPTSFMASNGFELKAGQNYQLSFKANPLNGNTKLRFAINQQPSLGGQTVSEINLPVTSAVPRDNFQTNFIQNFTVPNNGLYYLVISNPGTISTQNQIKFDEIRIRGDINAAPFTKLTFPTTTLNMAENANVLLKATATDFESKVNKVEFYANNLKIGEDNTVDYEYKWQNVPAGSYTMVARGVNDQMVADSSKKTLINVLPSQFKLSSFLGGVGNDDIRGLIIQNDGSIVIGGNFANGFNVGVLPQKLLAGATTDSVACIIKISKDGKQILSTTRLPGFINDISKDTLNNIYIAAGGAGAFKLDPTAQDIIWNNIQNNKYAQRIDAGLSGKAVVLFTAEKNPDDETYGTGASSILYSSTGELLSNLGSVGQYFADVAIDEISETVIGIGFKNVIAQTVSQGRQPVYISVVRGFDFNGNQKYVGYNWEPDSLLANGTKNPNFINKPTNNMADTRAYRCEIGQDNKLYILHEVYGGNHIFRYSPSNVSQPIAIVGGDMYNTFSNTGTEVKLVVVKHNPQDLSVLLTQQMTNRINPPLNTSNTIFGRTSGIMADSLGRVYITGSSAAGLPISLDYQPGEYSGGAYVYVLSPNFAQREIVTRLTNGTGRALDVLSANHWAFAGNTSNDLYQKNKLQSTIGGLNDSFFTVKSNIVCDKLMSKKSGKWNDPATWSCGRIPMAGEKVIIQPGHVITTNNDIRLIQN